MSIRAKGVPAALRRRKHAPEHVAGHVEKVETQDRFLNVRYGKEPGEYLILYVPSQCLIHRDGERIPLVDVQFCDSVDVWFQCHHRFDVQLAQEIELN